MSQSGTIIHFSSDMYPDTQKVLTICGKEVERLYASMTFTNCPLCQKKYQSEVQEIVSKPYPNFKLED